MCVMVCISAFYMPLGFVSPEFEAMYVEMNSFS